MTGWTVSVAVADGLGRLRHGKPHNVGHRPRPGPFWLETQEGIPHKATDPDFFELFDHVNFSPLLS